MRDHLVDFSGRIADIEEIRQIERTVSADGVVHIVNEWRVTGNRCQPCFDQS